MNSSEMSPSRASLAAESAAEFPVMPTWPQTKTISLSSSRVNCKYNSRILSSVWPEEHNYREPDSIKNDLSVETCFTASRAARHSAVNMGLSPGRTQA